jgi:hypothetical protein
MVELTATGDGTANAATLTDCAGDAEALKSASPLYSAVMLCAPAVS